VKPVKSSLTRKQANQLCKTVGQMLVAELATTNVKGKADKLVAEYVKANKLDADPQELSRSLRWSVKVTLS
jgi:hypothetical protein